MTSDFFEQQRERSRATNQQAATTDCRTCGGDRLVLYQTRPAKATAWMTEQNLAASGDLEEYVPCPDCNATADTTVWTMGRKVECPAPDLVRQRLAQ